MTPATPPSSRGRYNAPRPETNVANNEQAGYVECQVETPKKLLQTEAPVTPSTSRAFKTNLPALAPPETDIFKSPFKGFHSPEYTPHRTSAGKRRPLQFEQTKGFHNISRVLFPAASEYGEEMKKGGSQPQTVLLPSSGKSAFARRSSDALRQEDCETYDNIQVKQARQEPGTPSHKVITNEMAEKWYSEVPVEDSENEDDEGLIVSSNPMNPFVSSEVPDTKTREQRKAALILENPDIEKVITYVDKKGNVVKHHHLSQEERERFRPKRLFSEELDDSKYKGEK